MALRLTDQMLWEDPGTEPSRGTEKRASGGMSL